MRPALVDAWRWSAVEAVAKLRAREVKLTVSTDDPPSFTKTSSR